MREPKLMSASEFLKRTDAYIQEPKTLLFGKKYREPNEFEGVRFKRLDESGILLYGLIQDRFNLSTATFKKELAEGRSRFTYVDKNDKIFCTMTNKEISYAIGWSEQKVIKIKRMLKAYDLLFEQRMGLTQANRLYFIKYDQTTEVEYYSEFRRKLSDGIL